MEPIITIMYIIYDNYKYHVYVNLCIYIYYKKLYLAEYVIRIIHNIYINKIVQ